MAKTLAQMTLGELVVEDTKNARSLLRRRPRPTSGDAEMLAFLARRREISDEIDRRNDQE